MTTREEIQSWVPKDYLLIFAPECNYKKITCAGKEMDLVLNSKFFPLWKSRTNNFKEVPQWITNWFVFQNPKGVVVWDGEIEDQVEQRDGDTVIVKWIRYARIK